MIVVVIGWAYFKPENSKFWSYFEFHCNPFSGMGAWIANGTRAVMFLIFILNLPVFYLKVFEHPSFGQVAHEIYPSEWKVHSSEISITINVLLIHVLDGCNNRLDPCDHFNLVCCCLSPVLISDKRSCWKISQSLKPIWLDVEMLVPL